jgi:hypothetical protein
MLTATAAIYWLLGYPQAKLVHVRFAPKVTKLPRSSEMTRYAESRPSASTPSPMLV